MMAKRPTGRPSLYSEELADKVCERLSHGEPLRRICADPDMPSFTTVWKWEKESEAFAKLSARARDIGTHNLADECIEIADNPEIDPANKRIMVDTRIRLIGKWNAKNYGDKIEQTLQNPDGSALSIVIRDMTKDA